MKIGIDIDEILTEYMLSFLEFLKKEKNIFKEYCDFSTYDFEGNLKMTREEVKNYIAEHTSNPLSLVELSLIEGSLESINLLDNNHEIIFITSRSLKNKE